MATIDLPELPTVEIDFAISPELSDTAREQYLCTWQGSHGAIPQAGDDVWLKKAWIPGTPHEPELLCRVLRRRWYHATAVTVYVELIEKD